jgi:ABC-2 type transport system ATP-binding protein
MVAPAAAIHARGLSKNFGAVRAVQDLDMDVPRAKIFGFLGPNGSGKSTTIRMLCGLLTPSAGEISVLGHEIPREAEALRMKVGYMTQRFSLYEDLSGRENLDFIANVYTLARTRRKRRIAEVSEQFELGAFLQRRAGTLSGGQRQRLALAAATLHEPELLFLDEPTSAVDPENRRAFWESLFDLTDGGTTILVSTHYMDEAERCHALVILDQGRVVASGAPAELSQGIDAQVVLVKSPQPRRASRTLRRQAWVRSVAQIGNELRVLVLPDHPEPAHAVERAIREDALGVDACGMASATLEDVFVAATLDREAAA